MSRNAIQWSGVFPAVSTQFKPDFSLDVDATHRVVKNLVNDGVSGLVVCGTVGENTRREARRFRGVRGALIPRKRRQP